MWKIWCTAIVMANGMVALDSSVGTDWRVAAAACAGFFVSELFREIDKWLEKKS